MKAVIFDMDGVLVDSERLWFKHDFKYFNEFLRWTEDDQIKLLGRGVKGTYEVLKEHGADMSWDEYIEHVNESIPRIYEQCDIMPHVLELIDKIAGSGLKIAIASATERKYVDKVVQKIGRKFDMVVSVHEEGCPHKPEPDVFLKTAKRLSVRPEDCIVIEDSPAGVKAAKAAGMRCIAYRHDFNKNADLSLADKETDDYRNIIGDF